MTILQRRNKGNLMLSEDDKREVKEVIRECFSELLSEQGLSIARHADDHRYIRGLQGTSNTIKKASWWTVISTLIAALLWAFIQSG